MEVDGVVARHIPHGIEHQVGVAHGDGGVQGVGGTGAVGLGVPAGQRGARLGEGACAAQGVRGVGRGGDGGRRVGGAVGGGLGGRVVTGGGGPGVAGALDVGQGMGVGRPDGGEVDKLDGGAGHQGAVGLGGVRGGHVVGGALVAGPAAEGVAGAGGRRRGHGARVGAGPVGGHGARGNGGRARRHAVVEVDGVVARHIPDRGQGDVGVGHGQGGDDRQAVGRGIGGVEDVGVGAVGPALEGGAGLGQGAALTQVDHGVGLGGDGGRRVGGAVGGGLADGIVAGGGGPGVAGALDVGQGVGVGDPLGGQGNGGHGVGASQGVIALGGLGLGHVGAVVAGPAIEGVAGAGGGRRGHGARVGAGPVGGGHARHGGGGARLVLDRIGVLVPVGNQGQAGGVVGVHAGQGGVEVGVGGACVVVAGGGISVAQDVAVLVLDGPTLEGVAGALGVTSGVAGGHGVAPGDAGDVAGHVGHVGGSHAGAGVEGDVVGLGIPDGIEVHRGARHGQSGSDRQAMGRGVGGIEDVGGARAVGLVHPAHQLVAVELGGGGTTEVNDIVDLVVDLGGGSGGTVGRGLGGGIVAVGRGPGGRGAGASGGRQVIGQAQGGLLPGGHQGEVRGGPVTVAEGGDGMGTIHDARVNRGGGIAAGSPVAGLVDVPAIEVVARAGSGLKVHGVGPVLVGGEGRRGQGHRRRGVGGICHVGQVVVLLLEVSMVVAGLRGNQLVGAVGGQALGRGQVGRVGVLGPVVEHVAIAGVGRGALDDVGGQVAGVAVVAHSAPTSGVGSHIVGDVKLLDLPDGVEVEGGALGQLGQLVGRGAASGVGCRAVRRPAHELVALAGDGGGRQHGDVLARLVGVGGGGARSEVGSGAPSDRGLHAGANALGGVELLVGEDHRALHALVEAHEGDVTRRGLGTSQGGGHGDAVDVRGAGLEDAVVDVGVVGEAVVPLGAVIPAPAHEGPAVCGLGVAIVLVARGGLGGAVVAHVASGGREGVARVDHGTNGQRGPIDEGLGVGEVLEGAMVATGVLDVVGVCPARPEGDVGGHNLRQGVGDAKGRARDHAIDQLIPADQGM